MKAIKILRGCGASGKSLEANKTYSVPEEVSESDAKILITYNKAVPVNQATDAEEREKAAEDKTLTTENMKAIVKGKKGK